MPPRMTFEERYAKYAFPEPNSGCFIWMGFLDKNGYGRMGVGYSVDGNRRPAWAHRAAYEYFVGPVPEGMELDHKCRVTCCVNPDHLEPVTHQENVRRGLAGIVAKAIALAKTHCKRGHSFSGNDATTYNGVRTCLICCRARAKRYRDERRARGEKRRRRKIIA